MRAYDMIMIFLDAILSLYNICIVNFNINLNINNNEIFDELTYVKKNYTNAEQI